jgi:DNA-binding NarL/FixJ family response regulator
VDGSGRGGDVSFGRDTLDICLSNPAGSRRTARGGRGLRGISERAAALGGTATAGPRSGRWTILESETDLTVVGEADDGVAVVARARRTRSDIVLMDVRMPRVDGIEATRLLGQFDGGGPAVIVVTTFENDDYVYDALRAGARGFLLQRASADDFVNAIRTVHDGESPLR